MNEQVRNPDEIFTDACRLFASGDYAGCESACRRSLSATPDRLDVLILLGDACTMRGMFDAAIDAYEKARALAPSYALPFTRLSCLHWRMRIGPCPVPRMTPPGAARIQMTSLGSNGRFGNQLLQYGFLKLYARRHGLVAEVPEWIGRYLYGFDDPLPRESLPLVDERQTDLFAALQGPSGAAPRDANLQGYFCGDTGRWGAVAEEFRALFRPVAAVQARLDAAMERLRKRGTMLVAIHIRRGDFGHGRFWVAPSAWYRAWLADLWPQLTRPVLYIATDNPEVADEFREYNPILGRSLEASSDLPDFVLDHFVLSRADYLAISNSSFSFSAAMLNPSAYEFRRPDPNLLRLVSCDPWREPVLLDPKVPVDAVSPGERAIIRTAISKGQVVINIGSYCSGWTNVVRHEHTGVMVREIERDVSLDEFRRRHGMIHINHARLEADSDFSNMIDGARATLNHARIDMFHLAACTATQRDAVAPLEQFGYRFFEIADNGVLGPVNGAGPNIASQIAIHERLVPMIFRAGARDLDLAALCARYRIPVNGVVHVGAHDGRELATYDAIGAKSVVFIEANPGVFERLVVNTKHRRDVTTILRAVTDRRGTVMLHVASFDQSSSILPMRVHRVVYPDIVSAGTMEVPAAPLDELLEEYAIAFEKSSLLCIDVQGAEHLVLRGAHRLLGHVQAVQVEVNFAEMYLGGAMIEDIEGLLSGAGFRRVALLSGYHSTWGDAFYVREPLATAAPHDIH